MRKTTIQKPVFYWLFLFLISLQLTACHTSDSKEVKNKEIRLITLAPHLAELTISAGAINNLVGITSYTDFPEEITSIQKVGDAFKLDFETILSLKPDYILTWKGGTPIALIEKLKNLKISVIETEINNLNDIPKIIYQIASLANTKDIAQKSITYFNQKLNALQKNHHPKFTAFIETYHQPLYTISGKHWMSQAANICGFNNIFSELYQTSATVTLESVILKNPQVIINIAKHQDHQWQKWRNIDAVKHKKIITIDPDLFSRPSMRLLQGIEQLCSYN